MTEFQLRLEDLNAIWQDYLRVDQEMSGSVTHDQLLASISETQASIAAPFFSRFFQLINRDKIDRVTFEELLSALVLFCLYTKEELSSFVFCMFDEDGDGLISKLDVFRFLLQFRQGYKVYMPNYTRAIEITRIKRGDKINLAQFETLLKPNLFLIYPAVRI